LIPEPAVDFGLCYALQQPTSAISPQLSNGCSIYSYGALLLDLYHEHDNEEDLVRAYGLISLLLELDGGGSPNKGAAEWKLAEIAEQTKITADQIAQAQAFAEQWRASHPPLSFFSEVLHPFDN